MTTLFLQSEMKDPFAFYEKMLTGHPVYNDEVNGLWAVYSYAHCVALLQHPFTGIPAFNPGNQQALNEYALTITSHAARLSNGLHHDIARTTAMFLIDQTKIACIKDSLSQLLNDHKAGAIDWVDAIAKRLPATVLLKSFEFSKDDIAFIVSRAASLAALLLPHKTPAQVKTVNEAVKDVYPLFEKQLLRLPFYASFLQTLTEKYRISRDEAVRIAVSNFTGLLIQSYDAGRGLLSNTLLSIARYHSLSSVQRVEKKLVQKAVIETLRFDPPVHHTRRIATGDVDLPDASIKKGDALLIVLAAANRDRTRFVQPGKYDIERTNNHEHLTFGMGKHNCPGKHWAREIATDALQVVLEQFGCPRLLDEDIHYEPVYNVRLPRSIYISFYTKSII